MHAWIGGLITLGVGSATLVLATIFFWGMFAARAARADLSTPFIFVAAGLVYTEVLDVLHLSVEHELIKFVAEVTLVWVLFADATRVKGSQLRRDAGLYARLLGIGLPLTIGLGTLAAVVLLELSPWPALLVAAALAPTDAALGAAVMSDRSVPRRVRRAINVESGLNDGIVTPVVLLAIAGVAETEGIHGVEDPSRAIVSLTIGLVVGAAIGAASGALFRTAKRQGWLTVQAAGPAVLALALAAYSCSALLEANGFVAAFVGGLVFGNVAGREADNEVHFVEQTAGLASVVSWLIFGSVILPTVVDHLDWQTALYAVLSLTVIRMVPVALALLGAGLDRPTIGFIGWFGPRGLASIIFALLALEELQATADKLVAVIGLTVALSVICHGFSAAPLSRRYSRSQATTKLADSEPDDTDEPAIRRLGGNP